MPVQLVRPTSSGAGVWRGQQPCLKAPRYIRGPGNSRWHRPRSGVQYPDTGRVVLHFWCGQTGHDAPDRNNLQYRDDPPPEQLVCGTCEGRAIGAGQDPPPDGMPDLVFTPRWQQPPRWCPGSRHRDLYVPLDNRYRIGRCLAYGVTEALRALGRGYNAYGCGLVQHEPGDDLVEACPFDGWQRIVGRDGKAVCACGWPDNPNQSPWAVW